MAPDSLHDAVHALASARLRDDFAEFASYMTPVALVSLRDELAVTRRPRRYRVIDQSNDGESASVTVEFVGSVSYHMVLVWHRVEGRWKVAEASVPPASIRTPLWRRLLRRPSAAPANVERRDLA